MKRRYRMIAVVFLLTGSLWACGVPLEDRAFPLSVAVDYTEGKYEVYYGNSSADKDLKKIMVNYEY